MANGKNKIQLGQITFLFLRYSKILIAFYVTRDY